MIVSFYWVFFIPTKNDEHYINQVCETKSIQVHGIITAFGGHGMYHWIEVDNLKRSLSVSIKKIKFKSGYSNDSPNYQVGDSIIKEANSKEFTIKRDIRVAVYVLDCDD